MGGDRIIIQGSKDQGEDQIVTKELMRIDHTLDIFMLNTAHPD